MEKCLLNMGKKDFKTIICPLVNDFVDDGFCFDTSLVAEKLALRRTLPDEIRGVESFEEICLKCVNHKDQYLYFKHSFFIVLIVSDSLKNVSKSVLNYGTIIAAELIVERADHTKEHMGLTTWADAPEGKIKKSDVTIAKNYLSQDEIKLK